MSVEPRREPLDTGDGVLVDAVGALVVRFDPSDQVGIVLDLEGRLNKLQIRDAHRYLLSAGMAAELIAELIVAGHQAARAGSRLGITGGADFAAELEAAIANEQQRRGLTSPGSGGT
jgi:pheromone shutdown protein TraB